MSCLVIETFTALAEPSRVRIVELLKDGPRPVGEIGTRLRLSQPQVSKHLGVLKARGWWTWNRAPISVFTGCAGIGFAI